MHKDTVVACARIVTETGVEQDVASFETTTSALLQLSDWLERHGVTHVAMEATGSYWKPVWHVLELSFELVLANAMHVKNVPGRKTDVNDATWIADLLAHGLIRGSFVPPTGIQELRALTRTRKQLVRERSAHVQRIEKVLQDANLRSAPACPTSSVKAAAPCFVRSSRENPIPNGCSPQSANDASRLPAASFWRPCAAASPRTTDSC